MVGNGELAGLHGPWGRRAAAALAAVVGVGLGSISRAQDVAPTGQTLTPGATPGAVFQALNPDLPSDPSYTAGQASAMAISPDGKSLLILTSGFNRVFGADGKAIADRSMEYVFVWDIAGAAPVKRQVLKIPNSFQGLTWSVGGDRFFVSGGVDDKVLEFVGQGGAFQAGREFKLGHRVGLGLGVFPETGGLAASPDGKFLLATNIDNDSVSLIDLATGAVSERDLRPGGGQAGGTFPRAVAWISNSHAYVTSERDREVIPLTLTPKGLTLGARIKTKGQPIALLKGRGSVLFVAMDNTDGVLALDTRDNHVIETIRTAGPEVWGRGSLGGAGSNALALSPAGRTLLVTNGGENAVAFVNLSETLRGKKAVHSRPRGDDDDATAAPPRSRVVGAIPTGWYPTAVAVRPDGQQIYVVNGKSVPGPVPLNCKDLKTGPGAGNECKSHNQYVWQREKAGFLTVPPPHAADLAAMTRQVAENNHVFDKASAEDARKMAFLREHIHHVIYIVKENRTYDQVLGDLEVGNGDPALTEFGRAMTPNLHALARQFVDLDNFYDTGESSNTGWDWTVSARTNDWTEREAPVNYADRGLQYDQEGTNRNVNVGLPASERAKGNPMAPRDPDVLAGLRDVAAADGPDGDEEHGYIWDQALKSGLTVRNWGFYGDISLYFGFAGKARIPLEREPWKTGLTVFHPDKASLMSVSDPYFRGFDQSFPDYWRFQEWKREFDGFGQTGRAPNLMLLRLAHDHTGDFGKGIDGVNTVETELADNDYAVGLVADAVAHSPFAKDTLIFVIEDDAQDGPDHVDAHRSIAFVVGPYVKQGAVVSHRYATVNLVRTMEEILGLGPMGLNDALAEPMAEVFDTDKAEWTYQASPSSLLRSTTLPLPPLTSAEASCPVKARSAAYWAAAMKGQDFTHEDHLDTGAFNLTLWRGLKSDQPYPASRDGRDLRVGRESLLARASRPDCG